MIKKIISILSLLIASFDFLNTFILFVEQKINSDILYLILIDFNSYITIWISLIVLIGLNIYFLINTKTSLLLFITTCIIGIVGCFIHGYIDIFLVVALVLYSFLFIKKRSFKNGKLELEDGIR